LSGLPKPCAAQKLQLALDAHQAPGDRWPANACGAKQWAGVFMQRRFPLLLTFNHTMLLLGACCVLLMVGFSYRDQRWGPWTMLVAVICLLLLMGYSILNLL
jgi:hypothetical protein